MKINEKLIEDIFKSKVKLKNKADKIKLSSYEDIIPMYDIYTQKIYPINKENIFYRLTESNYRFLNEEVVKWIKQMFDKYKDKLKKTKGEEKIQLENLLDNLHQMIKIIDNYDIDTLISISYKVLYQYSTSLGLSISICKRNSFSPYIFYLKPYYTKIELIKLGQNMGIVDKKLKPENLVDIEKHYEVCKKISNNDVSFEEIKNHTNNILENNHITDITFYSYIGANLLNRFLRNNTSYQMSKFYYDRLVGLTKALEKAPQLEQDYQVYRFINDDDFLQKLKVGDTFVDKGFLSSTRDPFYSSGISGTFGLILIKINLKKKIKGSGLFIEHFSLFPKEEEFLIPPFTKLKLVSKDDHFKYYHINESFEKMINTKYEFDLVGYDFSWLKKVTLIEESIPETNLGYLNTNIAKTKLDLITNFKNSANRFNEIMMKGKLFHMFYFDSTGPYGKFFYNNVEKGLSLTHYDSNGYPLIFIELGEELVVNYMNQYYFYNHKEKLDEEYVIDLITELGYVFKYKKAKIFNEYKNFCEFSSNYFKTQETFLYLNFYDNILYQYLKNNTKPFKSEMFYKNNFRKIDAILNKNVEIDMKEKFNFKGKLVKDVLIETIEHSFHQYQSIIHYYELDVLDFGELDIYEKLISMGKVETMLDLIYTDEEKEDDDFKLIFRDSIRRRN
jgi:hypothetical protein